MKLATLVAVSLLSTLVCVANAEVVVRPIAMTIGSPAIDQMDFSFQPNGVSAGTSVHLLITGLEHPVVKIDGDNSTLDKVTDSTGKDLLQERPARDDGFMYSSGPIGPFPKISEDGKQLIVELSMPQTPAPGSTSIKLEGKLVVVVAAGKKVVSAEGVATQPGQVTLGEHTIEITGFGPSDWEEGKAKLELKMNATLLDAIASWKITAPDGTELSDGPYSTMTMMDTAQLELTLETSADAINIELELYDGLQQIEVPVAAEVGLGIE